MLNVQRNQKYIRVVCVDVYPIICEPEPEPHTEMINFEHVTIILMVINNYCAHAIIIG